MWLIGRPWWGEQTCWLVPGSFIRLVPVLVSPVRWEDPRVLTFSSFQSICGRFETFGGLRFYGKLATEDLWRTATFVSETKQRRLGYMENTNFA